MGDESGASASARAPAVSPPSAPPATARGRRSRGRVTFRRWGCAALALALAFALLGIAPMSLAQRLLGLTPDATFLSLPDPFPPGVTPTAAPTPLDLALPRAAWAGRTAAVYRAPSAEGAPLATLGPGFPVTITAATATPDGVRWDHITWSGPAPAASGAGWLPHTALSAVGTTGTASADPGALSQALAAVLAPLGPHVGLVVYYPDAHRIYAANADVAFPLGDGMRGILETDLLTSPLASHPTLAGQSTQQVAQGVALGNAGSLSLAYAQLGGSAQVRGFLGRMSVRGITPDSLSWSAATGTPRGLAQFYAALAGVTPGAGGLSAGVRTQARDALAPDSATVALAGLPAPLPAGTSVLLVTGSAQAVDGWSMNAAGMIVAPSGVRYVVALTVRGQLSPEAARGIIASALQQLATVAAS